MKFIGSTTIHPFFFYTGKIAGYISWIVLVLSVSNIIGIGGNPVGFLKVFSLIFSSLGILIILISLINLGESTSLGLPSEQTVFKESGLYRFSRNPMYLGFNLLTLASMIFTINGVILAMGIYSIVVYHFIIVGEEAFLKQRFGEAHTHYLKRVRRYI